MGRPWGCNNVNCLFCCKNPPFPESKSNPLVCFSSPIDFFASNALPPAQLVGWCLPYFVPSPGNVVNSVGALVASNKIVELCADSVVERYAVAPGNVVAFRLLEVRQ
jgi:hypothetical protein